MSARKFLFLFCMCAAVPLVAAKISLSMGWFTHTSTNKGVWLEQEIQLLPSAISANTPNVSGSHWYLVYVQSARCEQQCEQALSILQQLYTSMGRKQMWVKPLVIAEQQPTGLNNFPAINWQAEEVYIEELQNQIVLVNQRGLALLRYPIADNPAAMREVAQGIRTDLLKLINYDRSGT